MVFDKGLKRSLNLYDACFIKSDVSQLTSLDMHSSAVCRMTVV